MRLGPEDSNHSYSVCVCVCVCVCEWVSVCVWERESESVQLTDLRKYVQEPAPQQNIFIDICFLSKIDLMQLQEWQHKKWS